MKQSEGYVASGVLEAILAKLSYEDLEWIHCTLCPEAAKLRSALYRLGWVCCR